MSVQPNFVFGLTGGIGSGKSAAASDFSKLGAYVIDVDQLSHTLTAPNGEALAEIAEIFPGTITDHVLDRTKLRELVFTNPTARGQLERILHPRIHQKVLSQLASEAALNAPYVLLMIPLLFESGRYQPLMRCVITVDVPESTQIERVSTYRNVPADTVQRIMATQWSRTQRLAHSQFVLDNVGTLMDLSRQVTALHAVLFANASAGDTLR